MRFLKLIGNSIHSPKFYATLPKKSFKQSFGYFLLLALILTVIHLITLINPLLVQTPVDLQVFIQDVVNCYPKDLEVKVINGQVSLNAEEPYFISNCKGGGYLAVIDTKTPFSSEKFDAYRVGAWINKDSIIYKRNDYETRTYNLDQIKDFKLNREEINSYHQKLSPFLKFVGPVLLLLSFVGIYLLYMFRLVHLLFVALFIWLLSKAFKQQLGYGSSYKVGLYAITLGLIVDLVVNLTSRWTNFYGFPFMVTVLALSVVLVNVLLPKKKN